MEKKYEEMAVKKALEPFNLFAFILHDPNQHKDFHEYLENIFDRLDYETGKGLLFFALINPPQNWLQHASQREYYQAISNWETKDWLKPENNQIRAADTSISNFIFSKSLGIQYSDLPCLVVTPNFKDKEFFWLPTNKNIIRSQLSDLGYQAARFDEEKFNKTTLDSSLAKVLSDDLSVMLADRHWKIESENQASEYFTRLFTEMHRLDEIDPFQNIQFYNAAEKLFLLLGSACHAEWTERYMIQKDVLPIDRNFLDPDSRIMYDTALRVYHLLTSNQISYRNNFLSEILDNQQDYSPAVVGVSKIFEREINLSIVHFLRKHLGIKLPEFFDKVQPDIPQDQMKIDRAYLNRGNQLQWKAPALGQSKCAFKNIYNQNNFPQGWDLTTCERLFTLWDAIHQRRNSAAHDRLCGIKDLTIIAETIKTLNENDYFKKFYELKCLYRGERPIHVYD